MPTYITLLKWTEQGVKTIKESPQRINAAREAARAAGGDLKAIYMVFGDWDMVAISEAPNDEAYARVMLAIAAQGEVRSQTLKAFNEEEFRRIVAGLP